MKKRLKKLEPIIFPRLSSSLPFLNAIMDTINSGNEEPIERIVNPANPSEIPRTLDISTVESTANLPPAPISNSPQTKSKG